MLQADERGHFITAATINGQAMPVLVDTGATAVAMNLSDALRAGVSFAGARRLSVQIGDVVVPNVEATVSEANDLPITLLGMSFLNQVEMQRSGRTLTLIRRH